MSKKELFRKDVEKLLSSSIESDRQIIGGIARIVVEHQSIGNIAMPQINVKSNKNSFVGSILFRQHDEEDWSKIDIDLTFSKKAS